MKLLLVGYGKMGRLIEELAPGHGCEIADRIDVGTGNWQAPADVAVDFSTADALRANFARYVERKLPAVIGTTGWSAHEGELRAQAERAGLGVVAAANFSIGVNLFQRIVAEAARAFQAQDQYGAWIHEAHHAAKRDAPSGTLKELLRVLERAGYERAVDVASNRAGAVPGTHLLGFDSEADTITLQHTARSRAGFAHGALRAARWVVGKKGVFEFREIWREI